MVKAVEIATLERIGDTRLRYICDVERVNPKIRHAAFLCDCGAVIFTNIHNVRFLNVTSCGCLKSEMVIEKNTKHGHASRNNHTGAYRSWNAMHQRVLVNPNYTNISICDRWSGENGFKNFYDDMGERPAKHSIERINSLGNYEPSNCKWATNHEQAQNTRITVLVTINNETYSIQEWCRKKGINYALVKQRRQRGWDLVTAIITHPDPYKSHKRKPKQ